MTPSREAIADLYPEFFDGRTRAAHLATLVLARATEPTGWPTIPMVRSLAKAFAVSASELGAFFGLICRIEGRQELWVDVFRNAPGTEQAKRQMTREQSRAFGFMLLAREA